jgi:hypothetical protein
VSEVAAARLKYRPPSAAIALLTTNGSTAAVAYDLTDGAAQAEVIGLTLLGRRIVAPTVDGDEVSGMREAALRPRIVREFLTKYDQSRVPSSPIALNVLEEMGVPGDAAQRALDMILKNAQDVGFLIDNGGKTYVNLEEVGASLPKPGGTSSGVTDRSANESSIAPRPVTGEEYTPPAVATERDGVNSLTTNRRVFVTHGRNRKIVEQLKELLTFGKFEPVVSVERESVAVPSPTR